MRLASLTVTNFRGFAQEAHVPLDADVVVIWGANGTGKTSLLDAFEWLVLGDIPRLGATALRPGEDYVSSRYADGPPSVSGVFSDSEQRVIATRTGHGKDQRLTVDLAGDILDDEPAEDYLRGLFPGQGARGDRPLQTCLLEQDDMRELLTGDTKERYRLLAGLTGLAEIQELDRRLQSELRSLRKALRDRRDELQRAQKAIERLHKEAQDSETMLTAQTDTEQSAAERQADHVRALTGDDQSDSIDAVLAHGDSLLEAIRALTEDVRRASRALEAAQASRVPDAVDVQERVLAKQTELADLTGRVESLQMRRVELVDSLQAEERRLSESQQLASLALARLGPTCPVCGQVHDMAQTRSRLEAEITDDQGLKRRTAELESVRNDLREAQVALARAEAELHMVREQGAAAQAAEAAIASYEDSVRDAEKLLRTTVPASVAPSEPLVVGASEWADDTELQLERLRAHLRQAESREKLEATVTALRNDEDARRRRATEMEGEVDRLTEREQRASEVCRWLGQTIVEITGMVVDRATPLAGELFKRFDVHPTFRRFSFEPDRRYESGHLRPWLHDDDLGEEGDATHVLSASQLNALAVCVFLAVNLEQNARVASILLDDPVQSMDDVSVLSLADVLRTLRESRQVILTTHEMVLAQMLARKLRPVHANQRTLLVRLSRWTRRGPVIEVEEGAFDEGAPEIELVGSDR